jgi:hypothetical protein
MSKKSTASAFDHWIDHPRISALAMVRPNVAHATPVPAQLKPVVRNNRASSAVFTACVSQTATIMGK